MAILLNSRTLYLIAFLICAQTCLAQLDLTNTPPVMSINRNWRISESETNGSVVTKVLAEDAENDKLEFGLEPFTSNNYGSFGSNGQSNKHHPFRIDPDSGVVYINDSLVGRGGENFFIYVTVTDGKLVAKNEVYVNIYNKNNTKNEDLYRSKSPSFTPNSSNIRQFLPPLHLLPGINRKPQVPKIEPSGVEVVIPHQTKTYPDVSYNVSNNNNVTILMPTNKGTLNDNSNTNTSIPILKPNEYKNTVLPIVMTICGIFLIAILIGLFVFRKYLCTISRFLKKKRKEDMAKKPNQNTISAEDSHNSIVMNQWQGSTAYNRYVPWERDRENPHPQVSSQLSNDSGTNNNSEIKSNEWDFPRHRLKFFNILGEGAFGQVWRCEASNIDGNEGITTVAVKTLKENAAEIERNDLLSELQVMKRLEPHVNVVRLLGCCVEKDPLFVILENVNRGKLQTYLRNSRAERHYGNMHGKSSILTSGDLTSFMYQVARGMDFLSSRGIIHRDLAARNVLITDEHVCKVADFGFARDVVTSKIYERKSEGRLPIRWMATESLYDNIFSVKSDIWSFGILMWEIVTLGSTPYPGLAAADVMKKVRDGYRLEKPEHCRRELYNIMYYCWAKDSNDRPYFTEVVQILDKLLQTETDYIELERFPDHNYYNMNSLSGEKL